MKCRFGRKYMMYLVAFCESGRNTSCILLDLLKAGRYTVYFVEFFEKQENTLCTLQEMVKVRKIHHVLCKCTATGKAGFLCWLLLHQNLNQISSACFFKGFLYERPVFPAVELQECPLQTAFVCSAGDINFLKFTVFETVTRI